MYNLIFKKQFLKNTEQYASHWLVLVIDCLLVLQAFVLAYLIRFNFTLNFSITDFYLQLPVLLVISLVSFLFVGSYKGVVRHTGVKDAINVVYSASLISLLLAVLVIINGWIQIFPKFTIPFSIIVIHYLLNVVILIASRFVFKTLYRWAVLDLKTQTNVIIYGAGDSGFITHSVLVKDTKNGFNVIGFIDDNSTKVGKTIDGVMVFNSSVLTKEFILKHRLKEVIVSIQNISPSRLMKITDGLISHKVKVKIVPSMNLWIDGELNVGQIKQVKIEDLLERAPIELENPDIKRELSEKVVFITGAAGSIGSEIARQVGTCKTKTLVLIDQAESPLYDLQQEFIHSNTANFVAEVADVTDQRRMQQLFELYKPQIIFHAAAYKHVPLMEENPYEAIKVNVGGTKCLTDLSVHFKVDKFVMVSTDKAVNPTNVMGATKRVAEMYISSVENTGKTKFITTRFGNVMGSNGSVIPLFKKQIETGGPITVTHKDITRYFMTIQEACQLVLEAGVMGKGGEIYVFDMGESVKIYDVAKKMIQLSGLHFPEDIDIKISGLRPGEKLFEELLSNGENTQPTHHDKIMIAQVSDFNKAEVKQKIEDICSARIDTFQVDSLAMVTLLKNLVPEYISNNSVYEKLDKSKEDSLVHIL